MGKFIVLDNTYEALHKACVFADAPKDVSRVIIDLQHGNPARVYIQKFADDSIIEALLLAGLFLTPDEEEGDA